MVIEVGKFADNTGLFKLVKTWTIKSFKRISPNRKGVNRMAKKINK